MSADSTPNVLRSRSLPASPLRPNSTINARVLVERTAFQDGWLDQEDDVLLQAFVIGQNQVPRNIPLVELEDNILIIEDEDEDKENKVESSESKDNGEEKDKGSHEKDNKNDEKDNENDEKEEANDPQYKERYKAALERAKAKVAAYRQKHGYDKGDKRPATAAPPGQPETKRLKSAGAGTGPGAPDLRETLDAAKAQATSKVTKPTISSQAKAKTPPLPARNVIVKTDAQTAQLNTAPVAAKPAQGVTSTSQPVAASSTAPATANKDNEPQQKQAKKSK